LAQTNFRGCSLFPAASKFHQQNATILAFPGCNSVKAGLNQFQQSTRADACESRFMPFSESRCKHFMPLRAGLTAFVSIVLSAFLSPAIGQQAPANPVDANLVNVLATVRDKHGKIVNNLSQNDFVLDEDGRRQAIRSFSRETDLPLTLGLLVDTSLSQRQVLEQERSVGGHFIDEVLREDKDKAFLIHFDREVELLQDLTSSKQKLNAALGALQQPQLHDEDDSASDGSGYPRSGRGSAGSQTGGTLYDSVYLASNELMLKQQGRKAVIVLSDGVDRGSKVTLERAIESARRANTAVYSILFAGKQSSDNGGGWERGGGIGGIGGMGGPMGRRGGYPRSPQPQQDRSNGKKILERISRETGGRTFEVSKKEAADQIYQTIQEELRNQYSLGYLPDRPGNANRKIHVTTTRKELVVQAREGNYPARQLDMTKEDAKKEQKKEQN
jgi:VWFA-related protein